MAPRPLADKDWPRIRYEYEHTDKQTHEICADHRISITTLNNRARQWGWTRRRQTVPAEGPPLPITLAQAPPPATPDEAAAFAEPSPHLAVPPAPAPDVSARQIARGLQNAIARVLAAIDAALAGLSAASSPRDLDRAGRAVAALTRTLQELNAMLTQFPKPERDENDEYFREELAKLERMAIVSDAYRKGILRDA